MFKNNEQYCFHLVTGDAKYIIIFYVNVNIKLKSTLKMRNDFVKIK